MLIEGYHLETRLQKYVGMYIQLLQNFQIKIVKIIITTNVKSQTMNNNQMIQKILRYNR